MTSEHPTATPHGEHPEEQPVAPDSADVERESPPEEMSRGKNYPSTPPENRGAFDAASTSTPQSGGQG